MNVGDVMTRQVITVRPDASIRRAARVLTEHNVSGLPVVDDHGRVVGIISDGDLIIQQKPRLRRPWWHYFFVTADQLAREFQKAEGRTVSEVMTRRVVSVTAELDLGTAAALLDRHQVRRLPVIDGEGRLRGILSRQDIVRAVAMAPPAVVAHRPDAALASMMRAALGREPWVSNRHIDVHAKNGVLILEGDTSSETEKAALETMAKAIEGVHGVENRLRVTSVTSARDDTPTTP